MQIAFEKKQKKLQLTFFRLFIRLPTKLFLKRKKRKISNFSKIVMDNKTFVVEVVKLKSNKSDFIVEFI